jgi:hypothetical protein
MPNGFGFPAKPFRYVRDVPTGAAKSNCGGDSVGVCANALDVDLKKVRGVGVGFNNHCSHGFDNVVGLNVGVGARV